MFSSGLTSIGKEMSSTTEVPAREYSRSPQPSCYVESPWIEIQHDDKAIPEADGKWMFFFPEHLINERWTAAKNLYNRGDLHGVSSIKVSTAMPSSRSAYGDYAILFICGPSNDEASIMKIGKRLISLFPPRNEFIYFKSHEQSRRCSKGKDELFSGGQEKNHLYRLRCTPITPIKMLEEDRHVAQEVPILEKSEQGSKSSTRVSAGKTSTLTTKNVWKDVSGLILVFDTETTGFPPKASPSDFEAWIHCRIMEIAWHVYRNNGEIVSKSEYLIKPEFTFDLHPRVLEVHGISKQKAENEGVPLDFALDELEKALSGVELLVGHNVKFDVKVVLSEIARTKRRKLFELFEKLDTCCTMAMGRKIMPIQANQKLSVLYEDLFGHPPEGILHRANTDVLACAQIFFRLKSLSIGTEELTGLAGGVSPIEETSRSAMEVKPEVDLVLPEQERFSILQVILMLILAVFMLNGFWRMLVSALL